MRTDQEINDMLSRQVRELRMPILCELCRCVSIGSLILEDATVYFSMKGGDVMTIALVVCAVWRLQYGEYSHLPTVNTADNQVKKRFLHSNFLSLEFKLKVTPVRCLQD